MLEIPNKCPSCGSELENRNGQLFCNNAEDCPAQNQKALEHFCKTLDLKGFGPATISRLDLISVYDFFTIDKEYLVSKLTSEKIADKLYGELEKLTNLDLGLFLASLGIPNLGKSRAIDLASVCSSVKEITAETCKKAGLGEKTSASVLSYIAANPKIFEVKLKVANKPDNVVQYKRTVCITGSLKDFKNRKDAEIYLNSLGYKTASSVTKDVSVLICEDSSKTGSSSYKKAVERNLLITTINDLIKEDNNV